MTDLSDGPDRAERALRGALDRVPGGGAVDPAAARRRARRVRQARGGIGVAAAALAVAVLVGGVIALPRWLPEERAVPASGPAAATPGSADPAPAGWRTEYYRSIAFAVPADWGYATAPGPDGCVEDPPEPAPEHVRPYVSLGPQEVVREIACPALPERLLTEHVLVSPRASSDQAAGVRQVGPWSIVTRAVADVLVEVTSRDPGLAERIAESARRAPEDAPCPPSHRVQGVTGLRGPVPRPFELRALSGVTEVAVCQYDYVPVESQTDPRKDGTTTEVPAGLRAVAQVSGSAAADLVATLAEAPRRAEVCPTLDRVGSELAVLLRIRTAHGVFDLPVQASGCPGEDQLQGEYRDGTGARQITPKVCRAILVPPTSIRFGSEAITRACSR